MDHSLWHYDHLFTNPGKLDSPDEINSRLKFDYNFMIKLQALVSLLGHKLTITSGYRSEAHNATVGGVTGSAHTKGLAVDISAVGGKDRFNLVVQALALGINRIGINSKKGFVHIDNDTSKTESIWSY